ncbi:hypothetical protein Tco_1180221, partial [Tanacetum coccineum]
MVTNTIDIVTSIPTKKELDLFCSTYNIPANLRPELPGPNDTIKDSLKGKIGIYTCFIEFANFRIPLSKFLLYVLQYYQINFSELSVLAATKISHFEIMCRVLGHPPSLGTFRWFYCNSFSNCWLSFSKRSPSPCCFSKNLDSLKNWIDASVFPIFVLWYNDVSVKRGLLTSDDVVDLPLIDKLNHNCTLIRRCSEVFLCIVGLSYSFVDTDIHPTLLSRDKNDMVLLDFVKVFRSVQFELVRERTLAEVIPSIDRDRDMVVASFSQTDRQHEYCYESVVPYTKEFVSSSVTLTPERDCQDEYVSAHDENVRTRPASDSFLVLTSSSEHADTDTLTSPQVDSPTLHTIDSATAHEIYVPNWDVTNDARMDDLIMCRNLIDHMDAEIVDLKSRLERAKSGAVEVGTLRGQVSKPEVAPAAKAEEFTGLTVQNSELLGQVSGLESVRDSLKERVAQLESDCECLRGKVKGEAKLKEQFMAMKDVEIQRLMEHGSDLDARLSELIYQLDYELYLHMLTIVA